MDFRMMAAGGRKHRKAWGAVLVGGAFLALLACSAGDEPPKDRTDTVSREKAGAVVGGRETGPVTDRSAEGDARVRVGSVRIEPANPVTGDAVRAVVDLHNPLDLETSVHYRWKINGKPVEADAQNLPVPVKYGDLVSVEVAVSVLGEVLDPVVATVMVGNAPPVLELAEETVHEGEYRASFTINDPEGDSLRFRLLEGPEGMQVEPDGASLRWHPEKGALGVYRIAVEAEDGVGNRTQYTFDMTVSPPPEGEGSGPTGKTP
jgi:hypothetical protein